MFPSNRFPLEPSLWFATGAQAPQTQPLQETVAADFVIVGGGYAGLSTALRLAEFGHKPVVLEAKEVGFGASGRNGGQMVPGLKWDPDTLERDFGADAPKVIDFAANTTKRVFELIDKYEMNVPHVRNGWIQPAHNSEGLKLAEQRNEQWSRRGADVDFLGKDQVAALIGTDKYLGGWIDRRGGGLQPLSYVRELARVAQAQGATIYTDTPVMAIKRDGDNWQLTTSKGHTVKARNLVVCANAYSDGLWPGVKESVVDANTYQVATEILPQSIQDAIFPQGHVASDTRNLLFYFRKDHTGRFIMGGRGPFREPKSKEDWSHLQRAAIKMFPQLASVKWEFYWCGRVGVTRDYYPHLHEPAPNLFIDVGCMGRGVGLQTSMGLAIGDYLHSRDKDHLPLPITAIKPLPLYALRKIYVSAVVSWYRLTDGGS